MKALKWAPTNTSFKQSQLFVEVLVIDEPVDKKFTAVFGDVSDIIKSSINTVFLDVFQRAIE